MERGILDKNIIQKWKVSRCETETFSSLIESQRNSTKIARDPGQIHAGHGIRVKSLDGLCQAVRSCGQDKPAGSEDSIFEIQSGGLDMRPRAKTACCVSQIVR